jgi:site-specific DNA recombinase
MPTPTPKAKQTGTVRGYLRVSVDDPSSQTVEQSRDTITKWAALRRHDSPIQWYIDRGVSGRKPLGSRQEGARLLRDLRPGEVLAVDKLDRLARNTRDVLEVAQRVESIGADLVVEQYGVDTTTPAGKLLLTVLAGLAQFEADQVADRQRKAHATFRRNGRFVGRTPYGFVAIQHPEVTNETHLVLRPHPEQAPRLAGGIGAWLRNEVSLAEVARRLGLHEATLRHLLRSPRLIGRVPLAVKDDKGRTIRYDVDPTIAADPDAAIISTMVWRQLQARLSSDEGPRPRGKAGGWGAVFVCYSCGTRLYLDSSSGSYRCQVHHEGRPVVSRSKADAFAESTFLARWGSKPVQEIVVEGNSLERAERIAVLDEGIDATTAAMRTPGADIAALAQQVAQLHQERETVLAEPETFTTRTVETGETYADRFEQADEAGKLALLAMVISVRVHPSSREEGRFEALPGDENVPLQAGPRLGRL